MNALNTEKRWSYSGSLTTPPCTQGIYFNMMQTVYPIKEYHLNIYNRALKANAAPASKAAEKGNFRTARPAGPEHGVLRVTNELPAEVGLDIKAEDAASTTSLVMILLFCISMFLLLGTLVYVCMLNDDLKKARASAGMSELKQKEGEPVNVAPGPESHDEPIAKAE